MRPAVPPPPNRGGFTLVEILAAMSVLVVLVLVMSQLFGAASMAWSNGEEQVTVYDMGRSFADQAFVDLTTSIADENLSFACFRNVSTTPSSIGNKDGLYMISVADASLKPNYNSNKWSPNYLSRSLSIIEYVLQKDPKHPERGRLVRAKFEINPVWSGFNLDTESRRDKAYIRNLLRTLAGQTDFQGGSLRGLEVMLQNVYSFEVNAYPAGSRTPAADFYSKDYAPNYHPVRVDLKAIVLSDADWARLEVNPSFKAEEHGREFQTSAYFVTRGL